MTGGLHLGGGALVITGTDGLRRFNSNDGLFHTINALAGAVTFPDSVIGDGSGAHKVQDIFLGSCNPACTDVIGSVRCDGGGVAWSGGGPVVATTGIPGGIWQTVMGGSALVLYQDGHGPNSAADPNLNLYQMAFLLFYISGGSVFVRRESWVSASSQGNMNIAQQTVTYKLKVGLFT